MEELHFDIRLERNPTLSAAEVYSFVVRPITRRELALWQKRYPDEWELEQQVLSQVVLSHPEQFLGRPWDWQEVYAGLVQQVLDRILAFSGFTAEPDAEMVEEVNTYLESETCRYDLLIMTAFNYTLEQMEVLSPLHYHKLVGLAKIKLNFMGLDANLLLTGESSKKGGQTTQMPVGPPVQGQPIYQQGPSGHGADRRDRVEGAFSFTAD